MKNQPKVSVLLPVYNAGKFLRPTLASIQAQTFTDFEVIAVDNGCTDGSSEVLREFASADARFKIIPQVHHHLVSALNNGLSHCGCELVARMDADDLMLPQRLMEQYEFLSAHSEIAVLASCIEMISSEPLGKGTEYYADWSNSCLSPVDIANNMFWESPLVHPSVMFRRSVVLENGGYVNGPFPEDYELWLRLHKAGLKFHKLDQVLLQWRDHPVRMTRTDPDFSESAFARIRYQYLLEDSRISCKDRPLALWGGGRRTRQRLAPLLEAGFLPDYWVDVKTTRINQKALDRMVISPEQLLQEQPRPFVLVSVRNHGVLAEINNFLQQSGFICGQDYLPLG